MSPDKKYPDLASTLFQIHSVLKNLHSGERIQKLVDSYAWFTGYVWTEAVSGKKKLEGASEYLFLYIFFYTKTI